MNPVNRRAVLRSTGAAAAVLALRRSLFAFPGSLGVQTGGYAVARLGVAAKTVYGQVSGYVEDGINVFRSIPTAPIPRQCVFRHLYRPLPGPA